MSPSPLQTSHSLRLATGTVPCTVRVNNIQSTIQGPHDAWGRPGRAQPISVSVTVHLLRAFGSASASDALTPDTVHYGLLSKTILSTLESLSSSTSTSTSTREGLSLPDVLARIWTDLTGLELFASGTTTTTSTPFLRLASLKSLELKVYLPKASLQGQGVSLTGHGVFEDSALILRGLALRLHNLRVPVLIGVNENERLAKQGVVANVEVDRFDDRGDNYCGLESVVVEAMTSSSFETIEALLGDLAVRMTGYLKERHTAPEDGRGWHLRVAVEKPIAVVFADAPCVELMIGTNDVSS
ncbi:hypothetical protein E4U43_000437 [Claviceps pusilla]|uniref:Dihydroneopterin aldolase/epimerase domain-containing protein n=1 Tax=Claviceps pusilla TaxID=123648 RepID=A0A9P7NAN6_9HYPO|nr:hypothetical protein E4U43_000437 [Claviceps pusilla]